MQSDLQKFLQLDFFGQEGFSRKKCKKCGSYFWTTGKGQELCGDAPCVPYSFIGSPLGNKKHDLSSMRELFLSFFERNGHTRLKRYPVVARWRSDVYLTIASIADFQPHVTSGEVPPPANPLVISQPSIRLNDLEEVGRSGRHLTMFEMMGHHAFNNHDKVYWSEETIRYCSDFLEKLGIKKDRVTYKEGKWHGGGNAGACLEVIVSGMEVATLVFMNLRKDKNGKYEVNGEHYSEMPMRIVDTGYGLERLVWLTQGSPTIYDAIFQDVIKNIVDKAGIKGNKLHDIYAVADHARCLAFMLSDGIVPSNVEEGYLARLLIRRSLRLLSHLDIDIPLADIVNMHLNSLSPDFPELIESREVIRDVLENETKKFYATLEKGKRLVARYMEGKDSIPAEKLIQFYDTYGIPPEVVKEVAGKVNIPENFYPMVAEIHSHASDEKKEEEKSDYTTELLFYDKPYDKKFEATVLWKGNIRGKTGVILDRTLFYPEGGGQESDTGVLIQNGKKCRVLRAEKKGNAVVHIIDGKINEGDVQGEIDWQKRYASMRHHTATHIINASARKVLGKHIWQRGSQLNETEARLDVSHFRRISPDEIKEIERKANAIVMQAKSVTKEWLPRSEAEKKYGMRIYQGGPPKGSVLRIVDIPEIEVEACGGTHVDNTAEIGFIKITATERIQDGVERIKFCAGYKALEYVHRQEDILKETAGILNVDTSVLPKTVKRFFDEWKKLRKQVEKLQKSTAYSTAETAEGTEIVTQDELTPSAIKDITSRGNAVVISGSRAEKSAVIRVASSPGIGVDCSAISRAVGRILGGRGGGRQEVAQAGGPIVEKLEEAKKKAVEMVRRQLKEKKEKNL
ncbi:MAG: alanine--tRNA ligase [Candidatus Thermoplasmatota archaeon]|nr:alanine--tRNA ligase [Candidatus Thermoplasmatota archaeon]